MRTGLPDERRLHDKGMAKGMASSSRVSAPVFLRRGAPTGEEGGVMMAIEDKERQNKLDEQDEKLRSFDTARLRKAVREIIQAVGEDVDREGLLETPRRVADMYAEVFSGLRQDPADVLRVGFEEGHQELVLVKDIPFYSMCEHHFLPFHGVAHVGYIPNGRVVGLSKLARALEILARRPQLQERLTSQLADVIMSTLEPAGVAVVIKAQHLCMTMRGIRKPGSDTVTSAMRGVFRREAATRAEFMSLIKE
jgi:GTP cyclohydrolase IA